MLLVGVKIFDENLVTIFGISLPQAIISKRLSLMALLGRNGFRIEIGH
jgi:hypothetical protein